MLHLRCKSTVIQRPLSCYSVIGFGKKQVKIELGAVETEFQTASGWFSCGEGEGMLDVAIITRAARIVSKRGNALGRKSR